MKDWLIGKAGRKEIKVIERKIIERKVIDLKVYKNKKTGQASVLLPKKTIKDMPKKVKVIW